MKLPDFELERFFAKHEFSARHLLCSSDCQSMSIGELLSLENGAEQNFLELNLGYTESLGSPSLRDAICPIYDSVQPDEVLVFAGAQEAIYVFSIACLSPEDHVIVHSPCYQSLFEVAHQVGAQIDRWSAKPEQGWRLDLDELNTLLRPNTRAIIVNTPHNPTGYLMDPADWKALHDLAASRGIIVFCDEVYRESEYDSRNRLPAGCDMADSAVSLGVMSKTYGLAGLRIGWIATRNREVLTKLQSMKDYTSICNSAPSEFLAELGLRHRQILIDRNLQILGKNLDLLDKFFEKFPQRFRWQRPRAGAISFPEIIGQDASGFCESVLKGSGVLLAPASIFSKVSDRYFRLGFGRHNLQEGLNAWADFLRN